MKQCMECGARLGERDEFCTGCGARVYHGEVCESYVYEEDVEEAAAAAEAMETEVELRNLKNVKIDTLKLVGYLKEMFAFLKEVYTKPAAAMGKYGKNPLREASFILVAAMSMMIGLISMWMIRRLSSSPVFELLNFLGAGVSIPLWKSFFVSLGAYLLLLASLMLGLFASGQLLYNVRVGLLSLWNISAAAGVLYTTSAFITMVLTYLFPVLIPVFAIFIGIIALVSIYQAVKDIMNLPEDHAAFTVGFGFVVSIVIMYLVSRVV